MKGNPFTGLNYLRKLDLRNNQTEMYNHVDYVIDYRNRLRLYNRNRNRNH